MELIFIFFIMGFTSLRDFMFGSTATGGYAAY
jgi:hypothetical protein